MTIKAPLFPATLAVALLSSACDPDVEHPEDQALEPSHATELGPRAPALPSPELVEELSLTHDESHCVEPVAGEYAGTPAATPMSCTGQTPRKHIRINLHFVLHDDGTGNFRPTDDGFGDVSYTGYDFAQELIDAANDQLDVNEGLWLYSGAQPYVAEDFGVEFQLNGVYFHEDTASYNSLGIYTGGFPQAFAIDSSEAINVILYEDGTYTGGYCKGVANAIGATASPMIKMQNMWTEYADWGSPQSWCGTKTLLHEVGHLLNLQHTWYGDACADTPNNPNCWGYDANNPNCDQWGVEISNNVMDYNAWSTWSLSPCQLDRVHNELDGPLANYVDQCSECRPASVFFDLAPSQCLPIALDGTASDNEDRFFLEIYEVSSVGSVTVVPGTYFASWYPGQVGRIDDLGTFANYAFSSNKIYRIKVAVQSDDPGQGNGSCVAWDEQVRYVQVPSIRDCATSIDPELPPPEPL